MTEIVREKDVVVLVRGASTPVRVTSALAAQGWPGGIGLTWAESPYDDFLVKLSDGTFGGFALEGSVGDHNQWTGMEGAFVKYRYVTLCAGTWVVCISNKAYEVHTYASRQSGPLVPIVYSVGDRLRFSLSGKWTIEDEFQLSSDPRGSNQLFVGTVAQIPSVGNKGYLMLQTSL